MKFDNKIRNHVIYVKAKGYVANKPNGCGYKFTPYIQRARVFGSSGAATNAANFVAKQLGLASYYQSIQIIPVVLVEVK
jgi:hypothetical protein